MTPAQEAADLLSSEGLHQAWLKATHEAVEAHLAHEPERHDYWTAVQHELSRIAPRPGCSDVDVYRSANLLTATMGSDAAWKHAIDRGIELEGDLLGQVLWSRIADAVCVLAQTKPEDRSQLM